IMDTQEIVVKPLGKQLKGIPIFGGATILGNGEVVLILDVLGLALNSHAVPQLRDGGIAQNEPALRERVVDRQAVLLCCGANDARIAVPLSQVARLEEFSSASIENVGDMDVVQYGGGILHLKDLSGLLTERRSRERTGRSSAEESGTIQAIVYSNGDYKI